ncbi:MAG: hypothetical protein H0W02_07530 [Ktedonobacteraceae bacterium]|nr:hypothetical protein [Ktedonobacteraceae bacterium]
MKSTNFAHILRAMESTDFAHILRFSLIAALGIFSSWLTFSSIIGRARFKKAQQKAQQRIRETPQVVPLVPLVPLPPPIEPVPITPAVAPLPPRTTGRSVLLVAAGLMLVAAIIVSGVFATRFLADTRSQTGAVSTQSPAHVSHNASPLPGPVRRSVFEKGIIYPRWNADSYGSHDRVWQSSLSTIKTQTAAQWIEITILFSQATSSSTTLQQDTSTPSVAAFTSGVRKAHALGYHIFFVPLMTVRQPGGWSGAIVLHTQQQQQAWFNSYWHMISPYAQAAQDNGVEQMAIGTELQWLQQNASATLWNQLIARAHGVFTQNLTYDMNWSSLDLPMKDWLKNPTLAMIGVSVYIPLVETPVRVDPQDMVSLWRYKIKTKLDTLATQVGKPVLISEIGYRNSTDALYRTWEANSKAPADPAEQAGAYQAALSNATPDPQIAGIFFWAWDNVGGHSMKGLPAVQVLHQWYTSQ